MLQSTVRLSPHSTSVSQEIEALITKYRIQTDSLPSPSVIKSLKQHNGEVILVTGTTGSLGSYVLSYLLRDPNVMKIYGFNRPGAGVETSYSRHMRSFSDKGLDVQQLHDSRLVFLEGALELGPEQYFGLQSEVYEEVHDTVTTIIHLAWPVTFSWDLARFEPSIRAASNLMQFALTSPLSYEPFDDESISLWTTVGPRRLLHSRVKFIFASSITTTMSWPHAYAIPETVLQDPTYAVGYGYGEAKYVVQRILQDSPLNATSLSLGQLCGSRANGVWTTDEWFPLLLQASVAMDTWIRQDGVFSWLPVDTAAWHIVQISLSPLARVKRYPALMSLLNPAPISINHCLQLLIEALREQKIITPKMAKHEDMKPPRQWLETAIELAKDDTYSEALSRVRGVYEAVYIMTGLILHLTSETSSNQGDISVSDSPHLTKETHNSYREAGLLGPFEMKNIYEWSPTFKDTPGLTREDVNGWTRYWNRKGMFSDLIDGRKPGVWAKL